MKNKFLTILLLGAMMLCFVACEEETPLKPNSNYTKPSGGNGGPSDPNTPDNSEPEATTYTITLNVDGLQGATATLSKSKEDIQSKEDILNGTITITITPNANRAFAITPTVYASGCNYYKDVSFTNGNYIFEFDIYNIWRTDITFEVHAVLAEKIDGYYAVDLGLESGLLWAIQNIGATSPEKRGNYYAWGETEPKSNYYSDTYKWYDREDNHYYLTKYCNEEWDGYNNFTDSKITLDLEDDAAHVNWGGGWRMPTIAEIQELLRSSNNRTTQNGVEGIEFHSENSIVSIFLPLAGIYSGVLLESIGYSGYYWSSSLYLNDPESAYILRSGWNSGYFDTEIDSYGRSIGLPIRAVHPPK